LALIVLALDLVRLPREAEPLRPESVQLNLDVVIYSQTKSPVKAAWLSALLPGGGQFYLGRVLDGLVLGSIQVFLGYNVARKWQAYRETGSEADFSSALNWSFFALGAWIFSAAEAYAAAYVYDVPRWQGAVEREVEP